MNQILFTGDKDDTSETRKIIQVFCGIIIVFSIILIVVGAYSLIHEKNKKTSSVKKPQISVTESNGTVTINAKHSIGIDSLYYSWDNGEETKISANGERELTEQIELPNGDTTLNIRLIDSNQNESKAEKGFKYNENTDRQKPQIQILATSEKENVQIIATDNKEISYIEYKLNNNEAVKVENRGADKTKLEVKLEVKEETTLIVKAYDSSGNSSNKEILVKPVTPPKIELKKSSGELIIRVTDDEEVTKVVYNINGTEYTKDNTGEDKKKFEIRHQLEKGENIVKVIAYNIGGAKKETIGKCTY